MPFLEIALRDCVLADACPACASRDITPQPGSSLLPERESCPGGTAILTAEVLRARRLMVCDSCGLWFLSMFPNGGCIQKLNNTPEYATMLRPSASRRSFDRGWRALRHHFKRPGYILDVGASGGDFLRGCDGWHRSAMEPSTSSHHALSFCDVVYDGTLDGRQHLPTNHFDAVSLFDVAEHLPSPLVAFKALADMVKPGGILLIETGDTDSRPARNGALWYYVRYLAHFVFFNRRSLALLLERSGFRLLTFEPVRHEEPTWRTWVNISVRSAAYAALTGLGRRPTRWTSLATALGKSGAAPSLPVADHFFAVAEKV